MRQVVRKLADLGDDLVLAPERWLSTLEQGEGVPLGDLVIERRERSEAKDALVLDTTHAKDGLLDIHSALRSPAQAKSAKKTAREGELVVSRLRPYLRQIAYVHPNTIEQSGRPLAVSTEFYVLAPRNKEDLAFLLPFLLSAQAQSLLAAAQEGGHHPRVPRTSLLAMRVPKSLIAKRKKVSSEVKKALSELYAASAIYQALLSDKAH